MGTVYRARDSRLGRDVAIKVASERFSERFEREARAVAALNHPNISTLFAIGPDYLVMELVEGETLRPMVNSLPSSLRTAGGSHAYVTSESGADEVYVQPFPGPGEKRRVSLGGGLDSAWSSNGTRRILPISGSPN